MECSIWLGTMSFERFTVCIKGSNFHQPFKSNILTNSADPGKIPHHAAFLLDLYGVPK